MKVWFRLLILPLLIAGTTFCSRDKQEPVPTTSATALSPNVAASPTPTPSNFGTNGCRADTTGTGAVLFREAYNLSGTDANTFASFKAQIRANPGYTISRTGQVSGTAYDMQANEFSNRTNTFLAQYDDYLSRYGQYGAVENQEYIQSNIRDNFENTISPDAYINQNLSQQDKDQLRVAYEATKPQMERALRMYVTLAPCEPGGGGSTTRAVTPTEVHKKGYITFEQYLQLPASQRVADKYRTQGFSSFFKVLKKAVHIAVTVISYTVVAAFGAIKTANTVCGPYAPACYKPAILIGGAIGFIQGIVSVVNNQCVFGPC